MKDIKNLHVTQIRIFSAGVIPYPALCIPTKLNKLKDFFHFGSQEIPFPLNDSSTPNVLILNSGEIASEKRDLAINKLTFEGRKIMLEVIGDSREADFAFQQIARFINEVTGSSLDDGKCLYKTQETRCMAHLDINFWDIFSEAMEDFVKKDFSKKIRNPVLAIEPKKLTFEISFKQLENLEKEKIALSAKPFTIEPVETISLEKRTFFTHTPFDSDTHLEILRAFEKTFSSAPKSAKKRKTTATHL